MKIKLALLALLGVVLISSCKKKTHCPAFTDIDANEWFTYEAGNRDTFYSGGMPGFSADTLTYIQVNKSDAYISEDQDLGGSIGDCNTSYQVFSKETVPNDNGKSQFSFTYKTIKKYNSDTLAKEGQIRLFKNSIFDFGEILPFDFKKSVSSKNYYTFEFKDSVTFNGFVVFHKVFSMEVNTSTLSNVEVDKIWIAKDRGLIAYRRYPTGGIFAVAQ